MASASINIKGLVAWREVDVLRIRWMVVICARKVKSVKFLDTFLHFLRVTMEKRVQTYCCRKLFFYLCKQLDKFNHPIVMMATAPFGWRLNLKMKTENINNSSF